MADLSSSDISAEARSRNMISTIGFIGAAGCFLAPKENYLTVQSALTFAFVAWSVFCFQFLCTPGFFFSENFSKGPKDNFGILFMRMFGLVGFAFIYLSRASDNAVVFPVWCAVNAAMCFVGPQRGEICAHPNVLAKHIVPHVALCAVSLGFCATLL